MKNKQDGGFSLIEVVLAMVILALIVVPTCTSLVLSGERKGGSLAAGPTGRLLRRGGTDG